MYMIITVGKADGGNTRQLSENKLCSTVEIVSSK